MKTKFSYLSLVQLIPDRLNSIKAIKQVPKIHLTQWLYINLYLIYDEYMLVDILSIY